jgi:uncharacterized protein (DUF1501 family)
MRKMMPTLDAAYTALLEDLADRGMLDDTLVVWMAEFGRTPKINGAGGRDHWGPCFSVALAGGGVKGGAVYGSSDRLASSISCSCRRAGRRESLSGRSRREK